MPNQSWIEEINAIIEKAKKQTLSNDEVARANQIVLELSRSIDIDGLRSVFVSDIIKERDPFEQVRRILEQTDLADLGTKPSAGVEDRIKAFAQKARRAAS